MKNTVFPKIALVGFVACLAACTEKPQVAGTQAEGVDAYSKGGQASFNTPGWKPGDEASWSDQIKQRARFQNEYVRIKP